MGFLGDLFKKTAKNLISDAIGNATGDFGTGSSSSAGRPSNHSQVSGNGRLKGSGEAVLRKRLENEFAMNYSDCIIQREVSSSVVGAGEGSAAFSYGIYQNGQPIGFVQVVTSTGHYVKSCIRSAKEAAEAMGIPCLIFMSHLPNTEEYITTRLASNIRR